MLILDLQLVSIKALKKWSLLVLIFSLRQQIQNISVSVGAESADKRAQGQLKEPFLDVFLNFPTILGIKGPGSMKQVASTIQSNQGNKHCRGAMQNIQSPMPTSTGYPWGNAAADILNKSAASSF